MNDDFDWKKAQLIVPPRTSVWAYIDDLTGDLLISASDSVYQTDADIRINAEDIVNFIDRLTDLVGWPSAGAPREPSRAPVEPPPALAADIQQAVPTPPAPANGDSKPLTNAERQRRYREAKRNGVTAKRNARNENVTENVTQRNGRDTAVEDEPGLDLVETNQAQLPVSDMEKQHET
jgi:hypothetical protein